MSEYNHEQEFGLFYAVQLERAAESLKSVHPIGEVKAIGRLEVAQAVEDVVADLAALRQRCELAETALLACIAIPKREKNTFDATCEIMHVMSEWQQATDAAKEQA